jgi:hypothetical protein
MDEFEYEYREAKLLRAWSARLALARPDSDEEVPK